MYDQAVFTLNVADNHSNRVTAVLIHIGSHGDDITNDASSQVYTTWTIVVLIAPNTE